MFHWAERGVREKGDSRGGGPALPDEDIIAQTQRAQASRRPPRRRAHAWLPRRTAGHLAMNGFLDNLPDISLENERPSPGSVGRAVTTSGLSG